MVENPLSLRSVSFYQEFFQGSQFSYPMGSKVGDPLFHRFEFSEIRLTYPLPSLLLYPDQSTFLKNFNVLGNGRSADAKVISNGIYR